MSKPNNLPSPSYYRQKTTLILVWVWIQFEFCVCIFLLFFFFFLLLHPFQRRKNSLFTYYLTLFRYCLRTVHGTHSHFIQKKLKMGPTVLFTHLKIILLQYFQFSIFNFNKNKLYPNGPLICLPQT